MTNNEPELTNAGKRPGQLCLIYNYLNRELVDTSADFSDFFDTPFNSKTEPSFLAAFEDPEPGFLESLWIDCTKLKEKETKSFLAYPASGSRSIQYSILICRPSAAVIKDPGSLIVTVVKTSVDMAVSFSSRYADLVALAAHDLDSPLRKLSMLLDRITNKYERTGDEDTLEYVRRARFSLQDMRNMIDRLSLLAALANMPVKKVSINLDDLVTGVIKELEVKEAPGNLIATTRNLPIIQGDPGQYRLLFESLLSNAFKFAKKDGPVDIKVESEAMEEGEIRRYRLKPGRVYFRITVSDNGIGLNQEDNEKIFLPFVRLNGKSEYPGNGIGLALSKKIVENHCGIIYAEGSEKSGARITLFLPISPE